MIRIDIDRKLQELEKNRHWLSQKTESSYSTICNLCNNKTSSISFELLEDICNVLNCNINEILIIEKKQ